MRFKILDSDIHEVTESYNLRRLVDTCLVYALVQIIEDNHNCVAFLFQIDFDKLGNNS